MAGRKLSVSWADIFTVKCLQLDSGPGCNYAVLGQVWQDWRLYSRAEERCRVYKTAHHNC